MGALINILLLVVGCFYTFPILWNLILVVYEFQLFVGK